MTTCDKCQNVITAGIKQIITKEDGLPQLNFAVAAALNVYNQGWGDVRGQDLCVVCSARLIIEHLTRFLEKS